MLEITYNEQEIKLDRFFESLVYRHIIDNQFTINQKSILMFVTRKTIGFDKLSDNIGFQEFTWNLNIADKTIRKTISELIEKGFLIKEASKGGQSDSKAKYSKYRLGDKILSDIIEYWLDIKESNGFFV